MINVSLVYDSLGYSYLVAVGDDAIALHPYHAIVEMTVWQAARHARFWLA